jgi:hypothetical protein
MRVLSRTPILRIDFACLCLVSFTFRCMLLLLLLCSLHVSHVVLASTAVMKDLRHASRFVSERVCLHSEEQKIQRKIMDARLRFLFAFGVFWFIISTLFRVILL